ncbi:MAG: Holliday junction branch migration protein RuvA [Desulfobacterales bacterium]
MIGYIEGKLIKKNVDRVIVLANQVGYEVVVPMMVMDRLQEKSDGDDVAFFIYYQQSERQPKPLLIGFSSDLEREFFQFFITAEDVGPLKAVKALTIPISDIAAAIEAKDVEKLKQLKGIGERTAQKIVATLNGKMAKFIECHLVGETGETIIEEFTYPVMDVLVTQLGHKTNDAKKMIKEALQRNPDICTPEELFDEVYRGTDNS